MRADRERVVLFTWVEGKALFKDFDEDIMCCICGYSKRVCKTVTGYGRLTPCVVRNCCIDLKEGWCEEEKRCLDFDCSLNKTTAESYAKAYNVSPEKIRENVPEFGETIDLNRDEKGQLRSFVNFVKGMEGGVVLRKTGEWGQAVKRG